MIPEQQEGPGPAQAPRPWRDSLFGFSAETIQLFAKLLPLALAVQEHVEIDDLLRQRLGRRADAAADGDRIACAADIGNEAVDLALDKGIEYAFGRGRGRCLFLCNFEFPVSLMCCLPGDSVIGRQFKIKID